MAATDPNYKGAKRLSAADLGLLPLNEALDKVVGSTATKLTRPQGATVLVLKAETGNWQMKPGDHVSAFPTDPVATTTGSTAGNAVWTLDEDRDMAIAAPDELTVKAAGGSDVLRYYYF